ncbi:MAG: FecR domain-containing protein [SAR324 cluster bacterium]|nr:FecR domain-containing protein [SAR324 cluster bacterium]
MGKLDRNLTKQLLFVAGIFISLFLVNSTTSIAAEMPKGILITYLEDEAEYRSGEKNSWQELEAGQMLFPGYEVRTMAQTRLTLRLGDGSEVRVAPGSHLRINQQTDSETGQFDFQLMLGKAWAKFRKNVKLGARLILRTANATINIQGTSYEATVSGEQTEVRVFSGSVEVSGNSIAANQIGAPPSEIAPPHEVSREQWHVIVSAFYTISVYKNERPGEPKPFTIQSDEDGNAWVKWNLDHDEKLE